MSVPRRQGLVVALDLSFRQLAKLYAAIKGRRRRFAFLHSAWFNWKTWRSFWNAQACDIKISCRSLSNSTKAIVPGLLIASSVTAMRRQVLTRSAALYFGGRCED